jgi:hypothetical protein
MLTHGEYLEIYKDLKYIYAQAYKYMSENENDRKILARRSKSILKVRDILEALADTAHNKKNPSLDILEFLNIDLESIRKTMDSTVEEVKKTQSISNEILKTVKSILAE